MCHQKMNSGPLFKKRKDLKALHTKWMKDARSQEELERRGSEFKALSQEMTTPRKRNFFPATPSLN